MILAKPAFLIYSLAGFDIMIGVNIALTLVVGTVVGVLIWQHPPAVWTVMQTLGSCLLVVGFVLWTTARFQLGKSLAVTAQARQLVTRGLYSKFRNPIYVFGSCVIVGLILLLWRPLGLLVFVILVPLQIWQSRNEAGVLEAKFGEEYRAYRAQTWF